MSAPSCFWGASLIQARRFSDSSLCQQPCVHAGSPECEIGGAWSVCGCARSRPRKTWLVSERRTCLNKKKKKQRRTETGWVVRKWIVRAPLERLLPLSPFSQDAEKLCSQQSHNKQITRQPGELVLCLHLHLYVHSVPTFYRKQPKGESKSLKNQCIHAI